MIFPEKSRKFLRLVWVYFLVLSITILTLYEHIMNLWRQKCPSLNSRLLLQGVFTRLQKLCKRGSLTGRERRCLIFRLQAKTFLPLRLMDKEN